MGEAAAIVEVSKAGEVPKTTDVAAAKEMASATSVAGPTATASGVADATPVATPEATPEEDLVTPWDVQSGAKGVDYDRLIEKFGVEPLTSVQIARFEAIIQRPVHHLIRRGVFFSHRDLEAILEAKEKGIPFYLYTGRGPSSEALHLGHLIPFMITKWLQEVLDVPLVVQLTDDEKYLFKDELALAETRRLARENARDILAFGFDAQKTFIFSNCEYIDALYPTALKIMKRTTFNQVKGIFGFDDSSNIGKIMFPAIQAAPSFADCFPGVFGKDNKHTSLIRCLIPCAVDQDPYFRMTREVAPRLGLPKPSLICSKFIPSLQGAASKMSGSVAASSVFVTDSPKAIKDKINRYAFSGGAATAEEQRVKGADLSVDISYQYLTFFLEDDAELNEIAEAYSTGKMLTGEIKQKLISVIQDIVAAHQERKSQISDEMLDFAMTPERPQLSAAYTKMCADFAATIAKSAPKDGQKQKHKGAIA